MRALVVSLVVACAIGVCFGTILVGDQLSGGTSIYTLDTTSQPLAAKNIGTWRSTDVAVKVLKFQEMDEISFAEFKREIQMMEDIRSIYCINFIGAVTTPGKCCIVTEFCEHGSLSSVMRKYNMCYCLKVKMASDAAKGMNYLHTNGIIHRDFKPDNLLVTSLALNSPVNCKITDFGTTRDINEANATNKYTLGIGTVMYHAPEMILPATEGAYNQSCDVFSYAVTLYELYVDEDCYPPTLFKSFYQVSQFIMEGKRRPIPDSCPSDYARLVTDCWQQDPSARPSFKEIESRVQVIMEEARQNLDTNLPVTTLKQPSAGKPKPSLTTN
ncbi:tyrosine protein kinase [Pelomyxa schiedti]|nr:tyrosine protein kinase [Pelomyxa schiedti]